MSEKMIKADDEAISRAASILRAGGVVIIPTDTVYGMAALTEDGLKKIYEIKKRDGKKPIAFLSDSLNSVSSICSLSKEAFLLAKKFWPGALTLVIKKSEDYEGFRVPAHEWTRKLIKECGGFLKVTSANFSGEAPIDNASIAEKVFKEKVDLIVDGGACNSCLASTVVRVKEDGYEILRHGAIKDL